MIAHLTGTHADWVVVIARIVLGIIFLPMALKKCWVGTADLVSPAACGYSPNMCTFRPL